MTEENKEKPSNDGIKSEEKKEDKKEKWLSLLAVSTVILAVCATLSTFKGGGYSTKSVLNQSQASDQWAFYQSKSIKSYIYDTQREKMELELKALGINVSNEIKKDYEKLINTYSEKVAKYDQEKKEIEKKAKDYENNRDLFQKHSKIFGYGVIFLQIAILLSSIAALMKRKVVWYLGLVTGTIGIIYFIDGFFLFF